MLLTKTAPLITHFNKLTVKSVYLTHKTVLDRLTVSFILQEIQIQHHQARRDERRS